VAALADGEGKGSGRSVAGVDPASDELQAVNPRTNSTKP